MYQESVTTDLFTLCDPKRTLDPCMRVTGCVKKTEQQFCFTNIALFGDSNYHINPYDYLPAHRNQGPSNYQLPKGSCSFLLRSHRRSQQREGKRELKAIESFVEE
mmetsp:Transcript_88198/g.172531  ORF Transcript_88198/g.172531 Transcript_88198/m.172531 type:complete len:105 (+) Transcript_88198:20-334(+)